ncbi:MAG: LysR family transcriptional regulator [Bdellovibrionales bacterium]|nr:LysR family transcriptional regulator [Bdellovibrionales bacterium]
MMKYPRHLIESFVTFATLRNVSNTASALGISQPALSRQLQQLEELIGEKLFEKQGRQKVLSPVGQELFSRIQPTWQDYDSMVDGVISKFKDSPQHAIRIYGPTEILEHIASKIQFPYPLVFVPTRSHAVTAKVMKEDISLGITRLVPDDLQTTARKLFEEDFQILFPTAWDISAKSFSARLLGKLSNYPSLSYGEDFGFPREAWEKYDLGTPPTVLRVIPNWMVLQNLVETGLGWCIAPSNLVRKSTKFSALTVPSELMAPVAYYLLYKKDLHRIPWMKSLINSALKSY